MLHTVQHRCCIAHATCLQRLDAEKVHFFVSVHHHVAEMFYNCARMIQGCFTVCNMIYGTRKGVGQLPHGGGRACK